MDVARFVMGLGGENLTIACNMYASSWFQREAVNMAFGFYLSVVRVGVAVNFQIMGPIYNIFLPGNTTNGTIESHTENTTDEEKSRALGFTLLVAGLAPIISFFSALVMAILEGQRTKDLRHDIIEKPQV